MERNNIAAFPRPVYGRIPNFKGAKQAATNLMGQKELINASVIKVNPDSPQRPLREMILRKGKTLVVPTPRLKGEFYLIEPGKINDPKLGSTISSLETVGERITLELLPKIDVIVMGSVAVTTSGDRIGKGEGYSELEYAILLETGIIKKDVPIFTTVHEIQIVDYIPVEPFDVTVDGISTPLRTIRVNGNKARPNGLLLNYLTPEKIERTPFLRDYLEKTRHLSRL